MSRKITILAGLAATALGSAVMLAHAAQQGPAQPMRFFVASESHDGNFGGLAGADAYCQRLAAAAGAGGRTWHAYMSTQASGGQPAVNARDRIGAGPWHNAKGALIANNVADLHGDNERDRDNINVETSLSERGERIKARGDTPNEHDMLTGSDSHGRAFPPGEDRTCNNWTSAADTNKAMIGHHDRMSGNNVSWNSSHMTQGCSLPALVRTGGAGHIYCFAIN